MFSRIAEIVSKADAKNVDALLSNSDWCTNIWENAFWDEPVKKTGSPRCDVLFNERDKKERKSEKNIICRLILKLSCVHQHLEEEVRARKGKCLLILVQ